MRRPGIAAGQDNEHSNHTPTPLFPVADLYGDGEWMPLTDLVHCHVGCSMLILDERPTGPGWRISTPVLDVRRTDLHERQTLAQC